MPMFGAMEYFPVQILSIEDIEKIVGNAIESYSREWQTKIARQQWRQLADLVHDALIDVSIRGPAAKDKWVTEVNEHLERNERKRSKKALKEYRVSYIELLDRIYGAIIRHVLRHMPTAVAGGSGYFHLDRVMMFRYARLRATEQKSALEQLMEFLYQGGPRFETEFGWRALGDDFGEREDRRRRR